MEKEVRVFEQALERAIAAEDLEDNRPLLESASRISEVALRSFTGTLLWRALDVAMAIAEFDAELLGEQKSAMEA